MQQPLGHRRVWEVLDRHGLALLAAGWGMKERVLLSLTSVDTRASLAPSITSLRHAVDDIAQIESMEDK